jgi:hypothetical protein
MKVYIRRGGKLRVICNPVSLFFVYLIATQTGLLDSARDYVMQDDRSSIPGSGMDYSIITIFQVVLRPT